MPVWCVLKIYSPFLITDGTFSRPAEWKLSSSWKICSPTGLTKRLTWQITKKLGYGRGPSCQPLHVQYSSDGSCSLTMLTTPRGEHHGGGRRQGLRRGRRGSGEDAAVDAHVERSTNIFLKQGNISVKMSHTFFSATKHFCYINSLHIEKQISNIFLKHRNILSLSQTTFGKLSTFFKSVINIVTNTQDDMITWKNFFAWDVLNYRTTIG